MSDRTYGTIESFVLYSLSREGMHIGMPSLVDSLISEAKALADTCDSLVFSDPVWTVYNAYRYAWPGQEAYLRKFARRRKNVLYLGMNPGPWGMAQTGVPFGEVAAVRDWMGIREEIGKPPREHPKRPVLGFDCPRSEVSGRRLWGLFGEVYESAEAFFEESLVLNYCPLSFLLESGANLTPDKLAPAERKPLEAACDEHLRSVIRLMEPEMAVGVGGFATRCLKRLKLDGLRIGTLLHPSPASPMANRSWPERPRQQLRELGILQ